MPILPPPLQIYLYSKGGGQSAPYQKCVKNAQRISPCGYKAADDPTYSFRRRRMLKYRRNETDNFFGAGVEGVELWFGSIA